MDTFKAYYHAARVDETLDLLNKARDLRGELATYRRTAIIGEDRLLSEIALDAADMMIDALQSMLSLDRS